MKKRIIINIMLSTRTGLGFPLSQYFLFFFPIATSERYYGVDCVGLAKIVAKIMEEIQIVYLYNGKPYKIRGGQLDPENIKAYAKRIRNMYKDFTSKIISQGGYIEMNLSYINEYPNAISYVCYVKGINKDLAEEIEKSIPSR